MVNAIVNTLSDKEFDFLLELSSSAGRKMLLSALKAEIAMEQDLAVDYPTAELRKISGKIQRGREVTPQERLELQRSVASFLGKTKKGFVFESSASVSFLDNYIGQLPLYMRTVERSNRFVEEGEVSDKLFLGVSVSRLRSNSIFLSDFVKSNLHIYPKEITGFLKELIEEIIDLKTGVETVLYRLPLDEVQAPLLQAGIPYSQVIEMYGKSAGVSLHIKEVPRIQSLFVKVLKEDSEVDNFMQENKELTANIEILHDKYTVFFLHYFYNFLKEPLKKKIRVSHNTLLTFYRKGVELCGDC